MNDADKAQPQMNAIADALVFAITYISVAPGDSNRQDDDVRALESVMDMLSHSTVAERNALTDAAERAITAETKSFPNSQYIKVYRDFLDNLDALFPNDTNA